MESGGKINNLTDVERIQSQLEKIGFKTDLSEFIGKKITGGADDFHKIEYAQVEGDTVRINLNFGKVKTDEFVEFKDYHLQLLHKTLIEHKVINGVDTKKLDERMKSVDWNYEIAESVQGIVEGYKDVESVKSDLHKICNDKDNAVIAAQLWNNNVPIDVGVGKPDFIVKAEFENVLYPFCKFSAETTIGNAHEKLRGIANLETRMKNADWYFEYSDDCRVWEKGVVEIGGIKKDLESLSKLSGGLEKTEELWKNYVPHESVSKPDFLRKNETKENVKDSNELSVQSSEAKRPGFLKHKPLRKSNKRRLKP